MLDLMGVGIEHLGIFDDNDVWAQDHCACDNYCYAYLPDNFVLSFKSVFVLVFYLAVVVEKGNDAEPYSGDKHQQHIDI